MSDRNRQYGRSTTTSYGNLLNDQGNGEILNRCSNIFSKFTSKTGANSQIDDKNATDGTTSSSYCPTLVKYSKYEDPTGYADYKHTAPSTGVKSTKSKYDDDISETKSGGYRSRLAPSASFTNFSTLRSAGGLDGGSSYAHPSATTPDAYGLKGMYSSSGSTTPNYDRIGARYKPSRFLKSSLNQSTRDDHDDSELNPSKKSTKQNDYFSHYSSYTPSHLVEKYTSDNANKNSYDISLLRRGTDSLQLQKERPLGISDKKLPNESTQSILQRYPTIVENDTESTSCDSSTSKPPQSESSRRKERNQLMNMYSLPLDVLQNLGSSNSRKYRKRGKDTSRCDKEEMPKSSKRYDAVKEMAGQMNWYSDLLSPNEDPPYSRRLMPSASTGNVISFGSALAKKEGASKDDTPEAVSFVMLDNALDKTPQSSKPYGVDSYSTFSSKYSMPYSSACNGYGSDLMHSSSSSHLLGKTGSRHLPDRQQPLYMNGLLGETLPVHDEYPESERTPTNKVRPYETTSSILALDTGPSVRPKVYGHIQKYSPDPFASKGGIDYILGPLNKLKSQNKPKNSMLGSFGLRKTQTAVSLAVGANDELVNKLSYGIYNPIIAPIVRYS